MSNINQESRSQKAKVFHHKLSNQNPFLRCEILNVSDYFGRRAVWGYFRSASNGIPDQSEKQEYRSKPLMDGERERDREERDR